jgi:class 3 adenylate cyclase
MTHDLTPPPSDDDDDLLFEDETTEIVEVVTGHGGAPWRVLVADDDEGVRTVSGLALRGHVVDGAPIELVCVGSAAEAREYLSRTEDVAVALLDVVMESESAGLDLARWIRTELPQSQVRVILRTGQPGSAPESQVMSDHSIHDYLSKSETTARRLVTCITGAIRAWADLRTIRAQRGSLHRALAAVSSLFDAASPEALPGMLVAQLAALLAPRPVSVLLACPPDLVGAARAEPVVVAGTNEWAGLQGARFGLAIRDAELAERATTLPPGRLDVRGNRLLYAFDLQVPSQPLLALEAEGLTAFDHELIHLYCHTAALSLRSARMRELERAWLRALEKFVPSTLIGLVGHDDLRAVKPGDNAVHAMSVCFVDVRGFTSRTARAGANAAFRSMNLLFTALGEVVAAHGGIIDKYLGDGMLVLFPGTPSDALRAALEMQRRARTVPQPPGEDRLEIGIGVHTGDVVVGAVGHSERMDISVVSSVVNLAARVQALAAQLRCDILLTEDAYRALPESLQDACRAVLPHALRGDTDERVIYEAFGALEADRAQACRASAPTLRALTEAARVGDWTRVAEHLPAAAHPADPTVPRLLAHARQRASGRP